MSQNRERGNQMNQNQNEPYDLVITHYSPLRSPEVIIAVISDAVSSRFYQFRPEFSNLIVLNTTPPSFKISVTSFAQFQAVLLMNGLMVFNYPIWIAKYHHPTDYYLGQIQAFQEVFLTYQTNGLLDLSNFRQKFIEKNGTPEIQIDQSGRIIQVIDFNNREFVEFLFYSLALMSETNKFWVSRLILTNNQIKSIDGWYPFFHFLPTLKYVNLNDNQIFKIPQLQLDYQFIQFEPINTIRQNQQQPQQQQQQPHRRNNNKSDPNNF